MKDLTRDSIAVHIVTMAAPVAVGMLVHIAYQLITLYFVSRIGTEAVAGVNAAANVMFVVSAAAQVLSVGTAVLIAHGMGRKDPTDMSLVLNQSLALCLACAVLTIAVLYVLMPMYMATVSSNKAVVQTGIDFILWVAPGYALMFPMLVLSATLRSMGVVQTPMLILIVTVIADALLASLLISGYGFVPALGVRGAGLASSVSTALGLALMWAYFRYSAPAIVVSGTLLWPRVRYWRRILSIGLPAGAELVIMFLSTAVVYFVIRDQSASAQAGFGIGSRILQAILLPGLSVAFAAGPIAGQNFGAGNVERVREVFRTAATIGGVVMIATTLLVQWQTVLLLDVFDADVSATATAALFLKLMSWTFVAQGVVYTCTYIFQGLGNTLPVLVSATVRFVAFSMASIWLSQQPNFRIDHVWYLLTASVAGQAVLSLWLLHVEFKRKFRAAPSTD